MKYNKDKLHQLLYNAIAVMKYQDTNTAIKLAQLDQQVIKGNNKEITSAKIANILSTYLMVNRYKAPKSVIDLQQYVEKIAQVYNGNFSPIMWFQ